MELGTRKGSQSFCICLDLDGPVCKTKLQDKEKVAASGPQIELSSLQNCKVESKICNQNICKNFLSLFCLTYLKVDLWSLMKFWFRLVLFGLFARYTPVAPSNSQITQLLLYSAIASTVFLQSFPFHEDEGKDVSSSHPSWTPDVGHHVLMSKWTPISFSLRVAHIRRYVYRKKNKELKMSASKNIRQFEQLSTILS